MNGLQPAIIDLFPGLEQDEVRPMATITRREPEDLLQITDRPMPELIDGQLVEREPTGQLSDAVAANVLYLLKDFIRKHDLGLVNGAQGSYQIFADDPKKVRIPDVSFTRRERLPESGPADGHSKIAPDLTVEVISPNDLAVEVSIKVQDFLAAGVRLIWVVNPYSRDVRVYRVNGGWSFLRASETLDGEDILPGFRCSVEELFKV
jgi:Uma2 family endonuclease